MSTDFLNFLTNFGRNFWAVCILWFCCRISTICGGSCGNGKIQAARLRVTKVRGRGMPRPYVTYFYNKASNNRKTARRGQDLSLRYKLCEDCERRKTQDTSRKVADYANPRAGHAPPLPGGFPVRLRSGLAATGGIYAAPTEYLQYSL